MKIGAIDLFCGAGGLTCGLKKAGVDVVAGIDFDNSCKFPYEYNNNTSFINEDIHNIKGTEIKKALRGYDIKVLVGCAPCQPFSNHQKDKKNRKKHKDWSLLYEFSRIINECKPTIISMENVPELAKEKVFKDFIKNLEKNKYKISYSIVNVADYGVAQNRKRLILLASKKNNIQLISPTNKNNYVTVKHVIGHLPRISAGATCKTDELHTSASLSALNIERIKASKQDGTWEDWPPKLILKCHRKKTGKTYSSVYGRMSWNKPSPTITTQFTSYGTGRFGHPTQNRAISLREGALLQSFPRNYCFSNKVNKSNFQTIARQIGNAVPPRLGEIIGLSIIQSVD